MISSVVSHYFCSGHILTESVSLSLSLSLVVSPSLALSLSLSGSTGSYTQGLMLARKAL
jgi:hypothetical protein